MIGKKKIPAQKERFFGFVQSVSDEASSLTQGMGEESHETAGGTRHTEASRIAGQGKFSNHNSQSSYMICFRIHIWSNDSWLYESSLTCRLLVTSVALERATEYFLLLSHIPVCFVKIKHHYSLSFIPRAPNLLLLHKVKEFESCKNSFFELYTWEIVWLNLMVWLPELIDKQQRDMRTLLTTSCIIKVHCVFLLLKCSAAHMTAMFCFYLYLYIHVCISLHWKNGSAIL